MHVIITLDANGEILSVNRSLESVAHFLAGQGEDPVLPGGSEYSIENLEVALRSNPKIEVSYKVGETVRVEYHAVFV